MYVYRYRVRQCKEKSYVTPHVNVKKNVKKRKTITYGQIFEYDIVRRDIKWYITTLSQVEKKRLYKGTLFPIELFFIARLNNLWPTLLSISKHRSSVLLIVTVVQFDTLIKPKNRIQLWTVSLMTFQRLFVLMSSSCFFTSGSSDCVF